METTRRGAPLNERGTNVMDLGTARELAADWNNGNPDPDVRICLAQYQAAVWTDPEVEAALITIVERAIRLAGPADENHAWAITALAQLGASAASSLAATLP